MTEREDRREEESAKTGTSTIAQPTCRGRRDYRGGDERPERGRHEDRKGEEEGEKTTRDEEEQRPEESDQETKADPKAKQQRSHGKEIQKTE